MGVCRRRTSGPSWRGFDHFEFYLKEKEFQWKDRFMNQEAFVRKLLAILAHKNEENQLPETENTLHDNDNCIVRAILHRSLTLKVWS